MSRECIRDRIPRDLDRFRRRDIFFLFVKREGGVERIRCDDTRLCLSVECVRIADNLCNNRFLLIPIHHVDEHCLCFLIVHRGHVKVRDTFILVGVKRIALDVRVDGIPAAIIGEQFECVK